MLLCQQHGRRKRYTTDSLPSDSAAHAFPSPRKIVGSPARLPYNPCARIQSSQPDFLKHFSTEDYANMITDTLNLETRNGATTAHVALPEDAEKKNAAVILIQEWWGINDHIRDIASRYANEGYTCIAPDLFRGKVTKDPEEASSLMHQLAIEDGMDTIKRTVAEVRQRYSIEKIGITGYCMG